MSFLRVLKVLVVVIFLIASFFRIFFLDLLEFKGDEATTLFQVNNFLLHPHFIQIGLVSSTGAYNFPLFHYLMIGPIFLAKNPQVLSLLVALLNTVTVIVFFLMAKRFYGLRVATVASLLVALSPWGILFSRKIWAQDLILVLLVPFLYFLHQLILKKDQKATWGVFLLLVLLTQLHGSGIFLAAVTGVILLLLKVKMDFKGLLLGLALALIPALPYFSYQLTSTPFCRDCAAWVEYKKMPRPRDENNFIRPLQLLGGSFFEFELGPDYEQFLSTYPWVEFLNNWYLLSYAILPLAALVVVWFKRQYLFLAIYVVATPLLYFFTRTYAFIHYYIILIPIVALLWGLLFEFLWNNNRTSLKILAMFLLASFLGANVIFEGSFNHFLSAKKDIKGDYGPIFSQTKTLVEEKIGQYRQLPYYQELVIYSYLFAYSPQFHRQLGNFLVKKGRTDLAFEEFRKDGESTMSATPKTF